MKITQQIIAAAGFASLLFAPLAQAQESRGNVGLTVITDGLTVTGTELNFGVASVNPSAASSLAGDVSLSCAVFGGGQIIPILGGQVSEGNTTNPYNLVEDDATCGNVTVTADNADLIYQLRGEVEDLTGSNGGSISPRLLLYDAAGSNPIVGAFTPASPASSGNQDIAANASTSFIVWGALPLDENQVPGTYTGSYTITALVQTTPTP